MSHFPVVRWFGLLVAVLAAPAAAVAGSAPPTEAEVEQAVIAAIPAWHGQKATILQYLDLTKPFHTRSPWALVAAQDPHQRQYAMFSPVNRVAVCLVNGTDPHCTEVLSELSTFRSASVPSCKFGPCYERAYGVLAARVVFAAAHGARPLLLLKARSMQAPNGSDARQTILYRYDRKTDRFRAVFVNAGGGNNNQFARFVESGPLQGDEIVDFPTEHAPYEYWIEVYAPHGDGPYRRILRYRSATHYADGNPLPVADSEMPNILRRLGLWKPGDALPVPQPLPADCGRLVMNHGEEWCRNLCANYGGSACSRIKGTAASASRDR